MIRIYDTKMHQKVDLEPLQHGTVKMYVCGPTVYNYIHIGNARTFISFDMIRRYLEWRGFTVVFVQNVTDVDDKIINKANEEGRTSAEVAREYTDAFIEDMHAVNVKDPTVRPKATEEIDAMIALVQQLVDTGHAYATDDGDVYFSVRSFPGYGSLSGRNVDEMLREMELLAKQAVEKVATLEKDPWLLVTQIGEYGTWAKMRFVLKDVDHAREARDAALRAVSPYTRVSASKMLHDDGEDD